MKLLPIRIIAGWAVRWNTWYADDKDMSEDLLWLSQIDVSTCNPSNLFIDVGWYRDHYRAILAESWDNDPLAEIVSTEASTVIDTIEDWMLNSHKYFIECRGEDGKITRRAKTWRDNPMPRFYNPLEDDDLLKEEEL